MKALDVYLGSDGKLTIKYYEHLQTFGPAGAVAMNLFRSQKCSARAKLYRGGNSHGRYKDQAYERKNWSMGLLVDVLMLRGDELGITFGWKIDDKAFDHAWVLYVDIPTGQVSFHSPTRGKGPDYAGDWDGVRGASEARIIQFCDRVTAAGSTRESGTTTETCP